MLRPGTVGALLLLMVVLVRRWLHPFSTHSMTKIQQLFPEKLALSGLNLRSSFSRRNTSFRLALCSSSERSIRCHPGKQMRAVTFRGRSVENPQTPNEFRLALLSTGISLSPALLRPCTACYLLSVGFASTQSLGPSCSFIDLALICSILSIRPTFF